jgi:hypothetical protein
MESIRFLLVHLILPGIGISWFLRLLGRMETEKVRSAPVISLFILFFSYGGIAMVLLTALFWRWSGLASLGVAYLLFIAPLLTIGTAIANYKLKNTSFYHEAVFIFSLLYPLAIVLFAGMLYLFS